VYVRIEMIMVLRSCNHTAGGWY